MVISWPEQSDNQNVGHDIKVTEHSGDSQDIQDIQDIQVTEQMVRTVRWLE